MLSVEYHVEDHLPAEAVALIETTENRIDVYLSRQYPRDVVADHLGPLATVYCQVYGLHPMALAG